MDEHRKAHLDELRAVIDYIITSTKHPKNDPKIRGKIAFSIAQAIRMSKLRGGDVETPEDTAIYRIASALKEARTLPALMELSKGIKGVKTPEKLLTMFGLQWKTQLTLPASVKTSIEPKKENVDKGVEFWGPTSALDKGTFVHEIIGKYIEPLQRRIEDLEDALANHTHIDGKAVRVVPLKK